MQIGSKNFALKLTLVLVTLSFTSSFSQCNLTQSLGIAVPLSGSTFSTLVNYGPGNYFLFPVLNGGSYAVSTCGASIDTELTGWGPAASVVFYNDNNGPLCAGNPASVDNYIPNFTNYLSVQVSQFNCMPGGSGSINVYFRQNNNLVITSASSALCSGQTRVLSATPANVGSTPGGYGDPGTFSGTGVSGGVFTAPTVTAPTNYTITYTFGYVSTTQVITVNELPNVTASATNSVICDGESVTLTGGGANTYTWTDGISDGVSFTPTVTATYTVTGISAAGCSKMAFQTVTVNPLPLVSVSSNSTVICNGDSIVLTASGANSYTWAGGITNGVAFFPTASGDYSVTATSSLGCEGEASQSITVNALPTVSATPSSVMCKGEARILTLQGATVYSLNSVGTASNQINISPTLTTTYTLSGTDANGCTNSIAFTQTVSECVGFEKISPNDIGIKVYPNPNNGDFTIRSEHNIRLEIINDLGQIVKFISIDATNNYSEKINNLAPGVYFLICGDKSAKYKLVVLE